MNDIYVETFQNRKRITVAKMAGELIRLAGHIGNIGVASETYLDELKDASILNELELSILNLYLQTCYAENLQHSTEEAEGTGNRGYVPEDLPCQVYFSEQHKALLVDTPVVLKSGRYADAVIQENLLKSLVMMSVKKFEADNRKNLKRSIWFPFSFCLYRRCLRDQSSIKVPDIDNIEAQKIINSLVKELGLFDSYDAMITNVNSIEYVRSKQDIGTSILIVQEDHRNDLEREFLMNGRSFDSVLRLDLT